MITKELKKQIMTSFFALQPNNSISDIAKHTAISQARVQKVLTSYFETSFFENIYRVTKADHILVLGSTPAIVHSVIKKGVVVKTKTGTDYILSIDQFEKINK